MCVCVCVCVGVCGQWAWWLEAKVHVGAESDTRTYIHDVLYLCICAHCAVRTKSTRHAVTIVQRGGVMGLSS